MGDHYDMDDIMSSVTIGSAGTGLTSGNLSYTGSNITVASNTIGAGVGSPLSKDAIADLLDSHSFNQVIIDHKVSEQELMKMKEDSPTYADEIKEKISKEIAREVSKKVAYTKKTKEDTHHFMGRVWLFTTEEITELLENARNV